jgi:hypothetical protein
MIREAKRIGNLNRKSAVSGGLQILKVMGYDNEQGVKQAFEKEVMVKEVG